MRNILTTTFKFCQNIEIDFNQQFKTQHNFNKWFTNQGFLAFKNQPIESPLDSYLSIPGNWFSIRQNLPVNILTNKNLFYEPCLKCYSANKIQ